MNEVELQKLHHALQVIGLNKLADDRANNFATVYDGPLSHLPFIEAWVIDQLARRKNTAELKAKGNKAARESILFEFWDLLRDHPQGFLYFRDLAQHLVLDEELVGNTMDYYENEGILDQIAIGSYKFTHRGRKQMEARDEEVATITVSPPQSRRSEPEPIKEPPTKVFIGHGRAGDYHQVMTHLRQEFGAECVPFESLKVAGGDVISTLKELLESCGQAVIVATAEDDAATGVRARQNVVHEIGLFQGRYGFDRVAVLIERGTEPFSNISGLLVIEFEKSKIDQAFLQLSRFMRKLGFTHIN